VDARDEKLKKEHEEIDKIWSEICYKLDALSSLNFVPKQVSWRRHRLLTIHIASHV
jgi:U3 small nucleolar ribonucleoprotein component